MSFFDKFTNTGSKDRRAGKASDEELTSIFDEVVPVGRDEGAASARSSSPLTQDMNAVTQSHSLSAESSILSEALPSETAGEFIETRLPGLEGEGAAGSGLPLIGGLPLPQQQRLLSFVVGAGLLALALGAYLASARPTAARPRSPRPARR